MISMVTLIKGLSHGGLEVSFVRATIYAVGIGLVTMAIGYFLIRNIKENVTENPDERFASLERLFGMLMIFTACSMAIAHGSSDVANAICPLAAVNGVIQSGSVFAVQSQLPVWILMLGGEAS